MINYIEIVRDNKDMRLIIDSDEVYLQEPIGRLEPLHKTPYEVLEDLCNKLNIKIEKM